MHLDDHALEPPRIVVANALEHNKRQISRLGSHCKLRQSKAQHGGKQKEKLFGACALGLKVLTTGWDDEPERWMCYVFGLVVSGMCIVKLSLCAIQIELKSKHLAKTNFRNHDDTDCVQLQPSAPNFKAFIGQRPSLWCCQKRHFSALARCYLVR